MGGDWGGGEWGDFGIFNLNCDVWMCCARLTQPSKSVAKTQDGKGNTGNEMSYYIYILFSGTIHKFPQDYGAANLKKGAPKKKKNHLP